MPKGELRTEGKKGDFAAGKLKRVRRLRGPDRNRGSKEDRWLQASVMTAWAKPFRGSRIGGPREMPQPLSVDKKKKEKTRKGKREGKPRQRRRRVRWSKPPFMGLGFRFFLRFLPSSCAFISGCHCFVLLRGRLSRGLCPAHRLGNLEVMLPLLSKTARAKQENERSFLPAFMFSIPGGKPYGFIVVYRRSGGDEEGKFIPLRRCGF